MDVIEKFEAEAAVIEVEVLRRLAKAYHRNWYVFLLEDEQGRPALPRDFRTLASGQHLTAQTLSAFDDAEFLVGKILDLPRDRDRPRLTLPPITGLDSEVAARQTREALGVSGDMQRVNWAEYNALQLWSVVLAQAGVYAAQLSFPYREVRAFCLEHNGVSLIVVSSQDSPRARVFSMLHELGHLLLGGDAMCRPSSSDARRAAGAEEPFCNAFAAAMLMPADAFASDPLAVSLRGRALELGEAVDLARKYGVSELAALRRLATVGLITEGDYDRLHQERAEEFADEPTPTDGKRIRKQATRMINENSRLFASEVIDAHGRGDISFREIGVLLGGNLKHVGAIRERLAR